MSAPGTKLDHKSDVEQQTLAAVRQLLVELGSSRGLDELEARGTRAHLERDLGLGSLERVELMLRLGDACGVRLADNVMAETNAVGDLVEAIVSAGPETARSSADPFASRTAGTRELPAIEMRPDLEHQVRAARTLTEVLRLRALGQPDRPHIHLYGDAAEPCTITFGGLYERAMSVAAELGLHGLEPDQTVAIMLPTCAEFFPMFCGILLAGGVPVPIYPPFRADKIAEYATRQTNILRNAEAAFLLTWRQAEGLARLLKPNVPTLRGVLNAERLCPQQPKPQPHAGTGSEAAAVRNSAREKWRPVENLAHHTRSEDIAFLQYTSGSTGSPKGVVLTHDNLLANIRSMLAGVHVTSEDALVSWLPLYHDMGLIGAWLAPLVAGIPTAIMSPLAFLSRPERWLQAIHRHRATLSPGPNFAYELCLRKIADKDIEGLDLSRWRAALNGSETVQRATLERFAARFERYGFRRGALLPVYGLAENSLAVSATDAATGYRIDRVERAAFESTGRAVPARLGDATALEFVGAGRPLRDVECRIVTDDGADAGERLEGHLWFRGPSATSGYYKNAEATRELIRQDGWLESGDLAYWADGDLFITGRAKDVIIKAGRNLYPQEIEQVVGQIAGVRAGCVVAFGAPDERSGTERLIVVAEIRDAAEAKRISKEISAAVQETMALPPDVIELVRPQSIPKTSSGKLRRSETRRRYLEGGLGKKQQAAWLQIARLAVRGALPRAWLAVGRGARNTIEFLYGLYALTVCALVVGPLWVIVSMTGNANRAARVLRSGARIILKAALVRVRVEGSALLEELSTSGPWIFTPNHSSYVDIAVAVAILPPDVRFVAKGDAVDMPIFGKLLRRSGQHLFDRGDPAARVAQAQGVEAALGRGESLAVYPEGTFTAVTGIRPFQLGAFKAAVDAQSPICPVAIRGARQILRDKTYLPKFGKIVVKLGPLVRPDPRAPREWQEIVRLRDETRAIIASNTGEPLL